jgi:hypothetical protein
MPCDYTIPEGMTIEQRKTQIEEAIDRLNKALTIGEVKVVVGANGAVAFKGWDARARNGVSDVCAYRKLMASGSSGLRTQLARAEAMAGRKVDERAVAAGYHSHDGGRTFSKH